MSESQDDRPLWLFMVIGVRDESVPVVIVQAKDQAQFDMLALRLNRCGWKRITPAEFDRAAWPRAALQLAAVDVVRGKMIRWHTGMSSVYAPHAPDVTPMWASAAIETGRALVAVVAPGSFDGIEVDDAEAAGARLRELAARRELSGATLPVLFDQFAGATPIG